MSYDIYLFRRGGEKKNLFTSDLDNELKETKGRIVTRLEDNSITCFQIHDGYENYIELAYTGLEIGGYKSCCSYYADEGEFFRFRKTVLEFAKKMNLLIRDDQVSKDVLIEPSDYIQNKSSLNQFKVLKQKMLEFRENVLTEYFLVLEETSEHFVLFLIESIDPIKKKKVQLSPGKNSVFASKVKERETLGKIVYSYMSKLVGSDKFRIKKVVKYYDSVQDREGRWLNRDAVYIEIPYDNYRDNDSNYLYVWEEIE